MEDGEKRGLLEYLHQEVGCGYLSDLRYRPWSQECHRVIARIKPGAYTLVDWSEAYCYLLGHRESFADVQQARERILQDMAAGRGRAGRYLIKKEPMETPSALAFLFIRCRWAAYPSF